MLVQFYKISENKKCRPVHISVVFDGVLFPRRNTSTTNLERHWPAERRGSSDHAARKDRRFRSVAETSSQKPQEPTVPETSSPTSPPVTDRAKTTNLKIGMLLPLRRCLEGIRKTKTLGSRRIFVYLVTICGCTGWALLPKS